MSERKWTYEDLLPLPYDGLKHEIIDGVHYATEAHYTKEQRVVARLKSLLHYPLRPNFFYDRSDVPTAMGTFTAAGPRRFVIEVLPEYKMTFDEPASVNEKLREGVLEYWIAHPALNTVRVFRRTNHTFERVPTGDMLTTPLLPWFSLSVHDLFT